MKIVGLRGSEVGGGGCLLTAEEQVDSKPLACLRCAYSSCKYEVKFLHSQKNEGGRGRTESRRGNV